MKTIKELEAEKMEQISEDRILTTRQIKTLKDVLKLIDELSRPKEPFSTMEVVMVEELKERIKGWNT